ncbi:hypothetical protein [Nitrospira moscoviensis]|uniref:Uncharacterized protein n=1 Tax=Nitrospira moscoviensis TaxID=42253 RepID=A0A0K2GC75_NITMO|nr:hypothetical protein [Nitrospira moscoviensis]ALA58449.1 conserved membrane protein of unknown function [Nitrospira moscoviensis]
MNVFKPAVVYFLLVFGAGFVLGTVRVLLILPLVGERTAELLEMPLMLTVIVFAARWMNRHPLAEADARKRLIVGLIAMGLVLAADLLVGIALRGMSPSDALFHRDPISGTAYYLSLLLFAGMPWLLAPLRKNIATEKATSPTIT